LPVTITPVYTPSTANNGCIIGRMASPMPAAIRHADVYIDEFPGSKTSALDRKRTFNIWLSGRHGLGSSGCAQ
jgi:hypothetical protein